SIEDVEQRERELKLAELKDTAAYGGKEWSELLEAENQRLTDRTKLLEDQNLGLEEDLERVREDVEEANREADRWRWEKEQIGDRAKRSAERAPPSTIDLEELPQSLIEVVDAIDRFYPGRLIFTERARRAAAGASYRKVTSAWRCLRAMALV